MDWLGCTYTSNTHPLSISMKRLDTCTTLYSLTLSLSLSLSLPFNPPFYPQAQIQAKGNSIIEANIKIVKNGSYSFSLGGGTALYVTVDVAPCTECQQPSRRFLRQLSLTNHLMASSPTSGEHATTNRPFTNHHDLTSPQTFEPVSWCIQYVSLSLFTGTSPHVSELLKSAKCLYTCNCR